MSMTIDATAQYSAPVDSGGHSTYESDDTGGWLSNVDWGSLGSFSLQVWDRLRTDGAINEPDGVRQPAVNPYLPQKSNASGATVAIYALIGVVVVGLIIFLATLKK